MRFASLSFVFVSLLALTACQKKPEPQQELIAEQTNTPALIVCDDASTKNALIKALSVELTAAVNRSAQIYPDGDTLEIGRRAMQRLGELQLDLQEVQAEGNACRAKIVVSLPVVDTTHAERYYRSLGTSLQKQLGAEVGLVDNALDFVVHYAPQKNSVQLEGGHEALSALADIMTASAYGMAKSERIKVVSPTITVQTLEPIAIVPATDLPQTQEPIQEPVQPQEPIAVLAPEASVHADPHADAHKQSHAEAVGDNQITIVETNETY